MIATTFVLAMMLDAEPAAASSPWRDTYESSAATIAKVSAETPIFAGPDGPERTAALLVSLGWFEGRFDPRAVGDKGRSLCMFQIGRSNLAGLGTTADEILSDFEVCTRAAIHMARASFRVCRARPPEDRLGHYATGGERCGGAAGQGLRESRHRVRKARWLLRRRQKESEPRSAEL